MTFVQVIDSANSKTIGFLDGDFRIEEFKECVEEIKKEHGENRNLFLLSGRLESKGFTAKWISIHRVEF